MRWVTPPTKPVRSSLLLAGGPGLGHIIRCGALARHLKAPAILIGNDSTQYGNVLKSLPCPVGFWDDPPDSDLSIIDIYGDRTRWIARMRPKSDRIGVVTDDSYHNFQADYLINGHVGAENLSYHIPGQVLAGARYAPLRPQFQRGKPRSGKVNRLIVCLGSGRVPPELGPSVRAADVPEVYVYGGPADPLPQFGPHKRAGNGFFGRGVDAMAGADLAITTASMTALELLCLGVPCLTYTVADNQIPVQRGLLSKDAAETLTNADSIIRLVNDEPRRRELSLRGLELVDGKGAERVGKILSGVVDLMKPRDVGG